MKINVTYGPPGTGKSRHLVEAVGNFLTEHKAKSAMMCSHTRAAATTIRDRWAGNVNDKRLRANTLHSYCFEQLRLNRGQVVDDGKLTEFLADFGLDLEPGSDGPKYMELINYAAAMDISPMDIIQKLAAPPEHFEAVWQSYRKWKDSYGYVDFNDMLVRYCQLNLAPQFHMLAIDEAQDLSVLHWRVIDNMLQQRRSQIEKVLVVGDDDQSLFSYAGVDPQGMQKFAAAYDETVVRVLGQSYRVPRVAHRIAQEVIGRVKDRHPKEYLPTEKDGLVWAGEDIWRIVSNINQTKDTMILYADKWRREQVEGLLKEDHVPYVSVSGLPAPLQTAGGKALRLATQENLDDDDKAQIRRGLSHRAGDIWDTIGPEAVIEKLQDRDLSMIRCHWSNEDYFRSVELRGEPQVRIGTIHGVKGMEAEVVHLCTGISPAAREQSNLDPDSLHRLFYVGVTRTKNTLYIYDDENGYEI